LLASHELAEAAARAVTNNRALSFSDTVAGDQNILDVLAES
jgi:hypothetical protein